MSLTVVRFKLRNWVGMGGRDEARDEELLQEFWSRHRDNERGGVRGEDGGGRGGHSVRGARHERGVLHPRRGRRRRGLVAFHGEIEWGIGRFRVYGRGKRRGRGHAWPRRHACGRCHGPLATRPGERFAATEEGYKSVRSIYA